MTRFTAIFYSTVLLVGVAGFIPDGPGVSTAAGAEPRDREPKAIVVYKPQFPFELYVRGISGWARVNFTVDTNGNVVRPTVAEASHEDFGRSALSCISKWKFTPRIKDGLAVEAHLQVPFTFKNDGKGKGKGPH